MTHWATLQLRCPIFFFYLLFCSFVLLCLGGVFGLDFTLKFCFVGKVARAGQSVEPRVWEDDPDRDCVMQNPQRINQTLKKKKEFASSWGWGMLTHISLLEMVYESGFLGNSRKPKKKKKKTTEEASVRVGGLSFSFHENVNSQRKASSGLERAPGQGASALPHTCPLRDPKKGASSFSCAFKILHS